MKDGARVEIGVGGQRLVVPADVDDFAAIYEAEPDATIVAGSTDVGLWVTKHMRAISPAIFIGNLDGLKTISEADGVITIGAGVTYTRRFRDAGRAHSGASVRSSTGSAAIRCATWARSAATSPMARRSATCRRR